MKLHFDKLGAIDHAPLTLAPLTIICGENNTGKTWISYATYALFSAWESLIAWQVPNTLLQSIFDDGLASINLQQEIVTQWDEIRRNTAAKWKKFLPQALAAAPHRFENTCLSFDFELDSRWLAQAFTAERRSPHGKLVFSASKAANSPMLEITAFQNPGAPATEKWAFEGVLREVILEAVFGAYIPHTFMASAERTGATLFKDELNLSKNNMIGLFSRAEDGTMQTPPWSVLKDNFRRGYALPVDDNIRFVNMLAQWQNSPGPLFSSHPELLDELKVIAGGNYSTSNEGLTLFTPNNSSTGLYLTEASSAARALLILWYWLIGPAAKGDLLMIDEPEMNLHPANQCRMARWLAHLVNCGVRVFISTHSDYIVKEFNTLIMLDQRTPATRHIAAEHGYAGHSFLHPEDVRLYMCQPPEVPTSQTEPAGQGQVLVEAEKSAHLGLEVGTFDKTIDAMNDMQNQLYYAPGDEEAAA
jgi:hypothetical protein